MRGAGKHCCSCNTFYSHRIVCSPLNQPWSKCSLPSNRSGQRRKTCRPLHETIPASGKTRG
ncbi:uncharacterized protein LY89DRAFT_234468 [Mollisia scopiformis]|uniref:Uncharacterized protein n=1 Tax=Mollisia scopiformis TaxID=149040 RepID=A0A194WW26_MOLSC|nr:uncharacterized protein LY89DRAFT_234468 [Mollisia scopiformis]KUJ11787.1 hypothetical protein LY89DRAFT_234468 [Mollisia scopiformis]